MPNLSSKEFLKALEQNEVDTIKASYYSEGSIEINFDSFEDFLKSIKINHIPIVYYDIKIFDEEDIEAYKIDEEMCEEYNFPNEFVPILEKEINNFNSRLDKYSVNIGEEKEIIFFYPYEGALFLFSKEIRNFNLDDPEEFLETIYEKHKEKILEMREEERRRERYERTLRLKEIEADILNHEKFKTCTNKLNRKSFARLFTAENDEKIRELGLSEYDVHEKVCELWTLYRDYYK